MQRHYSRHAVLSMMLFVHDNVLPSSGGSRIFTGEGLQVIIGRHAPDGRHSRIVLALKYWRPVALTRGAQDQYVQ